MTFTDWIAEKLGTRMWVVVGRLTPRLEAKGYTVALSPKKYATLASEFTATYGVRHF